LALFYIANPNINTTPVINAGINARNLNTTKDSLDEANSGIATSPSCPIAAVVIADTGTDPAANKLAKIIVGPQPGIIPTSRPIPNAAHPAPEAKNCSICSAPTPTSTIPYMKLANTTQNIMKITCEYTFW
jgi:hypothetical protein